MKLPLPSLLIKTQGVNLFLQCYNTSHIWQLILQKSHKMSRNLVFIVRIEKLNSTDEIMEIMKRKSYFLLGKVGLLFP